MNDIASQAPQPTFRRFRALLKEHGIGVTKGYELVAAGVLETFNIGTATYATTEQFNTLPSRLKDPAVSQRLRTIKQRTRKAAA